MRLTLSFPLRIAIVVLTIAKLSTAAVAVDFNRDIRPLLAKQCFTCHGPDEHAREGDLRLDQRSGAIADAGGYQVIKPGDSAASEIMARVLSDDPDTRMPPADKGPPLSAAEIATLAQWIDDGATYEQHWSFIPPQRSTVPDVDLPEWCRGVVDRFVLSRMQQAGIQPSLPADRHELVRRLFLDLTGLPPTVEQVSRFAKDESPKALRRLVDELLASPDYGPHVASSWLDLARYADTNGYEKDRERTIWPYRDWVIDSLNADMPYDEFSIQQIAGDMLPNASQAERVATGLHRNTMLNEEGGIDPLEYRFYSMIDRVGTTGTIWMGLTIGCAQCHTHKYDPITQDDFYAMFGLLNQADEPELELVDAANERLTRELNSQIRFIENSLIDEFFGPAANVDETVSKVRADYETWVLTQSMQASDWQVVTPVALVATTPRLTVTKDNSILARGDITKREEYELTFPPTPEGLQYTALRLEALPHESLPAGGPGMAFYEGRRGDFFLSELAIEGNNQAVALRDASHSFGMISVGSGSADAAGVIDSDGSTGWSTATREGQANRLVVNFEKPFTSTSPWKVKLLFERHFAAPLGHFRISVTTRDKVPVVASIHDSDIEQQLARQPSVGTGVADPLLEYLQRTYIRQSELLAKERRPIQKLEAELPQATRTLVMHERSPGDHRTTHRHHRGEYLQPREPIQPGIPAVFAPSDGVQPRDRLQFARWLVSDANPLVGRVTVNRVWRQHFGKGIVDTAGDYGTQSDPPSHPQLLDWLALDFATGDWSLKRLHRQLVNSATYSQQVAAAPDVDPANRLLSCFPYRRLSAEQIRDSLLAAADLLVRQQGGPGVYPPQPIGVAELAYGGGQWPTSNGADRFRRSIYTFRKRTAPFAAYAVFDAPTGEVCLARRDPSTTPLQSLTLLNDELFIEVANATAEAVLRDVGQDASAADISVALFQRLLSRLPTEEESEQVMQFFAASADETASLQDRWMYVARALLNLDETITLP